MISVVLKNRTGRAQASWAGRSPMPPARRPVRLDSNESRRPFPPNDANSGPFQWRTAHFKYAHASELEEVLRVDDQAVDQAADRRDRGRVDHPHGGDIRAVD